MYRIKEGKLEVFLVHNGGPYWKNKDLGAWSIPKGEVINGENEFNRARKEINEETGIIVPKEKERYIYLGEIKQKAGKIVVSWALEDKENLWKGFFMKQSIIEIKDNFTGKKIKIPEIDKAEFFKISQAKEKINPAQVELINKLIEKLDL